MRNYNIRRMGAALKLGTLPLRFRRVRGNWCAVVPSEVRKDGSIMAESDVRLLDWPKNGLRRLRFDAASRYHAQVYEDSMECWINLRWAMKLPNWSGRFGALPELAEAMHRAGLIP